MSLDYKQLLKKYMAHVIDREGWSYIENGVMPERDSVQFTDEEWAELEMIDRLARQEIF